jgi:hypothetical protein
MVKAQRKSIGRYVVIVTTLQLANELYCRPIVRKYMASNLPFSTSEIPHRPATSVAHHFELLCAIPFLYRTRASFSVVRVGWAVLEV